MWRKLEKDKFRASLRSSGLRDANNRPSTSAEYFQRYHTVLEELADKFAPIKNTHSGANTSPLGWTTSAQDCDATLACSNDAIVLGRFRLTVWRGWKTSDTGTLCIVTKRTNSGHRSSPSWPANRGKCGRQFPQSLERQRTVVAMQLLD